MTEAEQNRTEHSTTPHQGLQIDRSHYPTNGADLSLSADQLRDQVLQANLFYGRINTLGEVSLLIDAARNREEILNVLQSEAKWLVDHDVCFASLVNKSRSHYFITTLSAIADATDLNRKHFPVNQGMPGWVIQHHSPIFIDVTSGPAFTESIEGTLSDLGMKSLMVIPLRTGHETIGALTFASAKTGAYREQEMWIAQLLGTQTATALKNAAIFDDAQKRLSQIEMVNEIAEKLTSQLEPEELLNSAAETIQSSFKYFDVTIFMVDEKENEAVLVAHAGSYVDFLPHGYRQKLSEGVIGWVATMGEACLLNDVNEDSRYMAYEYHSTKSELAVPIRVQDEIVGVLNIEDTKLHAFDETDMVVLETLCDQLGSAIKNAKLYDEVKRANTKLMELDRMKSDFLGIVSHDFRSPLASIILAARALLKKGETFDQRRMSEYLTIIVDQANRLSMLAEDTLSITKMESGQLNYFFKVVNMERLVKDAASLVHFSRRHTLEAHVESNVSYIKGDQTKLRQVLQNLLSNAVKYSPNGGKVIVKVREQGEDKIMVSVVDEGIGIPRDQLDRLFNKFSRVDSKEAREIKGSGLGLWICREIVKAHGGEIWAESDYGSGSRFCFTLKKAQPDSPIS